MTVTADVEDLSGNAIESVGDAGPGTAEPDRVDIGFLPANVNQDNVVTPFDLLAFRVQINECHPVPGCGPETLPFLDIDRSGNVTPFDLLRLRQLINGVTPATQPWMTASMNHPQP